MRQPASRSAVRSDCGTPFPSRGDRGDDGYRMSVQEEQTASLLAKGLRATTIGFVLIISIIAFETLAVGTAMPAIVRDLHGLDLYGWAFTALLMANVVGVALGGELTDKLSARVGLTIGLISIIVGLCSAGLAPNMIIFLVGRAAQGFGGGLVIVSLYVLAAELYHEALRPRLFAIEAAAWVAPAMVGPLLAGFAVDHFGWRSIFMFIAPLVLLSLLLIWPATRHLPQTPFSWRRLLSIRRWLIAIPVALGLALFQSAGQRLGWSGILLGIAGLALLAVAAPRLLPAGLFSLKAGIPVIVLCRGLANGAYNGIVAYVPLMLVTVHGFSATAAGLPLTCGTLGWALASWIQGRFKDAPRHRLVGFGFLALGIAAALLTLVTLDVLSGAWTYPIWVVGGAGVGTVFPGLAVMLLQYSPADELGNNSSGFSMAETMSAAITVGIGGALVAAAEAHLLNLPAALAIAIGLMGLLSVAGATFSARTLPPGH